jgi:HPt (histidine-containing phosphotransfer) domain-containing protein
MTASAGEDDQKQCIAVGMDAYISKPYEFENLLGTISRLLPDTGQFEPVLDAAPLASIRELNSGRVDVLARLIDVYLESSPPLVSQIGEAITAGNAEALRMGAHKLKSSSATLGASLVASLARDLEYLGRDKQLEQCADVFSSLTRAIEVAYSALEKEKSRSGTPAWSEPDTAWL